MDAYKVLGLTEGATEEEIKTAYRALAQKYNPDNYEAGPLREEAEAKMTELNEAFDALMGAIRTGTPVNSRRAANAGEPEPDTGAAANGRYRAIRQMINSGAVEQALAELNAIQGGANDAEWNFLVGSAYYYSVTMTRPRSPLLSRSTLRRRRSGSRPALSPPIPFVFC